jgi:hypothetical protein
MKKSQIKEEHSMKRTIITICITALITALGFAIAYSGVLTPSAPAGIEGVSIVQPTDGNLADLETLVGGNLTATFPRGFLLAQHELVRIKIKRARFMEANRGDSPKDARVAGSNLRWYDLVAIPIEAQLQQRRPLVTVITTKGSIVKSSRIMKVDDVKCVIITTDKQVKFIELI